MKLVIPFIAVFLCSCVIPIQRDLIVGEKLKGRVIDAVTRQPVSGAVVSYAKVDSPDFVSDEGGYFYLQPIEVSHTFWMPPVPVEPPPWFFYQDGYYLEVSAEGHHSKVFIRQWQTMFESVRPDPEPGTPEYATFPIEAQ